MYYGYGLKPAKENVGFYDVLLIASIMLNALWMFSYPYRNLAVISLSIRALMVICLVGFAVATLEDIASNRTLDKLNIITACMIVVGAIAAFSAEGFDYVHLLSFLELIIYCGFYYRAKRVDAVKKMVYVTYMLLGLWYIYLSNTSYSNTAYSRYGEYQTDLTLGYNNPNETAMYLLTCMFVLFAAFFQFKNKLIKAMILLELFCIFSFIFETKSRTAILIIFIFLALNAYVRYFKFKKNEKILSPAAILAVPIGYVILSLLNLDIQIFGESLSNGREELYNSVFENMTVSSFLFGKTEDYTIGQNLHNVFVAVLGTTGIVALVLFIWFLTEILNRLSRVTFEDQTRERMISFCAFACIVFQSSTEAAWLTSGGVYAVSALTILILGLDNDLSKNIR